MAHFLLTAKNIERGDLFVLVDSEQRCLRTPNLKDVDICWVFSVVNGSRFKILIHRRMFIFPFKVVVTLIFERWNFERISLIKS